MKVLLYFGENDIFHKSGIGRAQKHQTLALKLINYDFTYNKNDNYDIAHINIISNESYRLLKKCKKKKIPVIVHGHSTREDFKYSFRFWKLVKTFYFYPLLNKLYKKADLIITPTIYSKNLINSYGFNTKIINISNGINVKDYIFNQQYIDKFKKCFDVKDNQKIIIGIGFPFERKGIFDFFNIAKKRPDITFIWFGSLKKILLPIKINKAIKHKPKNVIFPGYIENEIIKGALQYASLLLFTSYEETEGIAVLEALASKCLVLVRDIGAFSPWLVDNKSCLKAKNNKEFIDKIDFVLDEKNKEQTNKIKEKGYEVANSKSIENISLDLKKAYDSLIK